MAANPATNTPTDDCGEYKKADRKMVEKARTLEPLACMEALEEAMRKEDSPCLSSLDILREAWEEAAKKQVHLVVDGVSLEAATVYLCPGLEKGQDCRFFYADDTIHVPEADGVPLISWPKSGKVQVQIENGFPAQDLKVYGGSDSAAHSGRALSPLPYKESGYFLPVLNRGDYLVLFALVKVPGYFHFQKFVWVIPAP
jgi:hypothetical protein